MTDKRLSGLMGGDSRGRRGRGENSAAEQSPTAEAQRRYDHGAKRNTENVETEASWSFSGLAFFLVYVKRMKTSDCM